jgi:hypothetical protein
MCYAMCTFCMICGAAERQSVRQPAISMNSWRILWQDSDRPGRTALSLVGLAALLHAVSIVGPDRSSWYQSAGLLGAATVIVGWWMFIRAWRRMKHPPKWDPMAPLPKPLPRAPLWTAIATLAYGSVLFFGLEDTPVDPGIIDASAARMITAVVAGILLWGVLILSFRHQPNHNDTNSRRAA